MGSISDIIKIAHETRVDDPTCIRKLYLFREGNFTRAYDISAWMIVHFVCGKGSVNQPKPTRRTLKDGTDFVFAGHIHKQQVIPGNGTNIVYCSSLKQKNYGETVSGHGFVLYDVETGDFEFVETPNKTTSFYKFSITDLDDVDNNEEILLNP